MKRVATALFALTSAAAVPICATGQDAPSATGEDVARAKTLFEAGARAYSAGDYEAALQAFGQAQRLAPRAAIVFSMAQAHRRQFYVGRDGAHAAAAVALYRRYLDEVPRGGRRSDAVEALGQLEPAAGRPAAAPAREVPAAPPRLMVTSTAPNAEIAVDDEPFSASPAIRAVTPGTHRIRVRAPGFFEESRQALVVEGAFVPVDVPLRPRPASLNVTGPAGASVALDGRVIATLPLSRPLQVGAGRHHVEVLADGRVSWHRDVALERAGAASVAASLERSATRWAATGLLATGSVAVVAGGVLGALSLGRESEAQALRDAAASRQMKAAEQNDYETARAARDDLRTGAIALAGAGVATALVGVGLWMFDTAAPKARPPPLDSPAAPGESGAIREVAVTPIPGGIGFAGRF